MDQPKTDWPLTLYAESRAEALAHGVLYAVPMTAGMVSNVSDIAVTAAVHHMLSANFRDTSAALFAVVATASLCWLERNPDRVEFTLPIGHLQTVEGLEARRHTNDSGEPCITIGIPQDWAVTV